MARGFEKPPIWAWVVIVASLVGFAVLVPVALGRDSGPTAAEAATANAEITAARASADAEAARNAPVDILVIGDSYTGGSSMDSGGAALWPTLVAGTLSGQGQPISFAVDARGGTGYVNGQGDGTDFGSRLAQHNLASPDIVLFFGSRNDQTATRDEVYAAASAAFSAVRSASPDVPLMVIGPPWVDQEPPTGLLDARDGLAQAAAEAEAVFVDPIAATWFPDGSGLIGSDGVHPTDAGHQHLAELIAPAILPTVEAVRSSR